MDANILRVVKIDKEALYEFIYENFIAQQEELLDISKSEVMNDFGNKVSFYLLRIDRKTWLEN